MKRREREGKAETERKTVRGIVIGMRGHQSSANSSPQYHNFLSVSVALRLSFKALNVNKRVYAYFSFVGEGSTLWRRSNET